MKSEEPIRQHEILLYTAPDGTVRVEVAFEDETFWLTQKRMAELFGVEIPTVNYHLREIFKSEELNELATIRKIRIVRTEGTREVAREIEFYSLGCHHCRWIPGEQPSGDAVPHLGHQGAARFSSQRFRSG